MFSTVPMTLEQIVEETRQLPTDVVAELVDRILLERHGGIEPEIEAAWKSEIGRRIEQIETGKVQGIPVDESLARIFKIAGLRGTRSIPKRTPSLRTPSATTRRSLPTWVRIFIARWNG